MYLASVSSDLLIHDTSTWDLKICKKSNAWDGTMRDLTWSDDSKYIVQVNSAGRADILISTELQSVQPIPSYDDHWSASFHRGGHSEVALGTKFGSVKIWDTEFKMITKNFSTPSKQSCVKFLSYNANNTCLAATMVNGYTVIYGLISNNPDGRLKLENSKNISAMKFHLASLIGLATYGGHIGVRDIATSEKKALFEYMCLGPVSDLTFSPINKNLMLSCGYDKIMRVYDIRKQNSACKTSSTHFLTSIAINTDHQIALGTRNGKVFIYDLRNLSGPFRVLKGHNHKVSKVAFQPAVNNNLSDISLEDDISLKDVETVTFQKIEGTASGLRDLLVKFFSNISSPRPSHNIQIPHSVAENRADQSSLRVWNWLDESSNFHHNCDLNIESDSEKHDLRVNKKWNMVSKPIKISDNDNNPNNTQDEKKESDMSSTLPIHIIDLKIRLNALNDKMEYCLKRAIESRKQKLFLATKELISVSQHLDDVEKKLEANNRRRRQLEKIKKEQ